MPFAGYHHGSYPLFKFPAAVSSQKTSPRLSPHSEAAVDGVSHGFTALHDAAHRGRAAAVAELLRSSASASPAGAEGATPLELAARAGHCEAGMGMGHGFLSVCENGGDQESWFLGESFFLFIFLCLSLSLSVGENGGRQKSLYRFG